MPHCSSAYLIVPCALVDTRVIAIEKAGLVMLLKWAILMNKFVLLVVGNRTDLRFIGAQKYFILSNCLMCARAEACKKVRLLGCYLPESYCTFNHKHLVLIHWLCLFSRSDIGPLLHGHLLSDSFVDVLF